MSAPDIPTWCPGCGDFAIWEAFNQACAQENWNNSNSCLVAGIGCHGHIVNFLEMSAFEGLHGRTLPLASGIKISNPNLNVFVFSGDGDGLSEGGNHFIHACRRNHNLTVILHDNSLYALTTGQTSPRSPHDFKTKSSPYGNPDQPLQPLQLALTSGATFLARAYSGDIPKLKDIIIQANNHKGLSIIQVLQPCVTFNKLYTHYFFQHNTYWLPPEYNSHDKTIAYSKLSEWGEHQIPLGVFYQEDRPTYEDQNTWITKPMYQTTTNQDISQLLTKFA